MKFNFFCINCYAAVFGSPGSAPHMNPSKECNQPPWGLQNLVQKAS